nr:putative reverse transcriptase domain-containing protein [Tanacetum cinerariifolium]
RSLEFQPGDRVFLKVSPACGIRRLGIKGKLSPRFIVPFEILDRVGEVSYRLALPPQLSHVHNVFHVSLLRGNNYSSFSVEPFVEEPEQPSSQHQEQAYVTSTRTTSNACSMQLVARPMTVQISI